MAAVTDSGVTFVVMPLLSLIEDNLTFVKDLDIPACTLSSGNSRSDEKNIGNMYQKIRNGDYKLIYLTPEKIVKSPGLVSVMDDLYA